MSWGYDDGVKNPRGPRPRVLAKTQEIAMLSANGIVSRVEDLLRDAAELRDGEIRLAAGTSTAEHIKALNVGILSVLFSHGTGERLKGTPPLVRKIIKLVAAEADKRVKKGKRT